MLVTTARSCASWMSSRSRVPRYEYGWKRLSASTAGSPCCLQPKTRSIHWCSFWLTCGLSRASRCLAMKILASPLAQGGRITSLTGPASPWRSRTSVEASPAADFHAPPTE
ncbi:hypothetical protein P8C59_009221 [Phyllachora maydis]|uniref:Uncharacterized protein n=1 Tax=Phyllachora maydis TaxID=1825666 RepID=A0AAD9MJG0_9PEZI|nr:hypothetical protein P8C59_009221 [Phyllachora maydis]